MVCECTRSQACVNEYGSAGCDAEVTTAPKGEFLASYLKRHYIGAYQKDSLSRTIREVHSPEYLKVLMRANYGRLIHVPGSRCLPSSINTGG
jgi:hypothetical protein